MGSGGGKGGKSYTTGYRYFLGVHAVLCQHPIDGLMKINFDDRNAWRGFANDEQIRVFAEDLFGGKEREGGVGGYVDVLGGGPTQPVNDYLALKLNAAPTENRRSGSQPNNNLAPQGDGFIPAFRGVVSMVFRQFYWGNNPYIKSFKAQVKNIYGTWQNWLPELAPINPELSVDDTAIYIVIDNSLSMGSGNRIQTTLDAMAAIFDLFPDTDSLAVKVVICSDVVDHSIEFFEWNEANRAATESFLTTNFIADGGAFSFVAAVSEADAFFTDADTNNNPDRQLPSLFVSALTNRFSSLTGFPSEPDPNARYVMILTDGGGAPGTPEAAKITLDSIDRVSVIGINIVSDDTAANEIVSDYPVPVVADGQEAGIINAFASHLSGSCDINPAHILRDILISPYADGTGDETLIGDKFAIAAQRLYDERFGLTFFWNNPREKDAFKQRIEQHIDGAVYFDRVSGKWEINLVRDDYDVADLFTFDRSKITEWPVPPTRADQSELPNQITLIYTRRDTGNETSVTLTNTAAVVSSGRLINEKVTFEGITDDDLANRVCLRELTSRSTPAATGAFRASYLPPDLNIGSAFILDDERVYLQNTVCRIVEIEETDGKDNSILVRFTEDTFSQDIAATNIAAVEGLGQIDQTARASDFRFAAEMPYYQIVQTFGELDTADILAADPDAGFWAATCEQPNNLHLQANVVRDDGGTWITVASTQFVPIWRLKTDLTAAADDTSINVDLTGRETEIAANELMQIGEEVVRVDSVTDEGDGTVTFVVGRGVLDTPPRAHKAGDRLFGWFEAFASDVVQYTNGETVDVQILPATRSQMLGTSSAQTDTIEFDSRAIRPYPVGRLQMNGFYTLPNATTGTVTATWAHRDRTIQTTAVADDHAAGNIGPEAGVSYQPIKKFYGARADLFALADFFETDDFFVDYENVRFVELAGIATPQSTTFDFNADDVDLFDRADFFDPVDYFDGAFDRSTRSIGFAVRVLRGTSPVYENWLDAEVTFTPLLSPINFEGADT